MQEKNSGQTAPIITTYQYPKGTGMWHYSIVTNGAVFVNDGGFDTEYEAQSAAEALMRKD